MPARSVPPAYLSPYGEGSRSWTYSSIAMLAAGLSGRGELVLLLSGTPDVIKWFGGLDLMSFVLAACVSSVTTAAVYAWHCHQIKAVYRCEESRANCEEWKCQPDRWLSPELEREEAILGTLNSGLATMYVMCFLRLATQGYTAVYFNIAEHSWVWYCATFAITFAWIETWAYWTHRFWHIKCLYPWLHKWHHRFQPPTPFSAVAFHPLEFAFYVVGGQLLFLFVPVHPTVMVIVGLYTGYYLIEDHCGIKRTPMWPWQPSTQMHDDHHKYFHCNFGQHIVLFDVLCGTIRKQSGQYGESIFYQRK